MINHDNTNSNPNNNDNINNKDTNNDNDISNTSVFVTSHSMTGSLSFAKHAVMSGRVLKYSLCNIIVIKMRG